MSAESDIAARIASKGLRLIEKTLDQLDGIPREDWSKTHVRDITDCVLAAIKVQADDREQLAFERENDIGDLRRLLVEHLASMSDIERSGIMAEAAKGKKA